MTDIELKKRLKDMLEDEVDEKYYLSDKQLDYILDGKDVALKSGRDINNRIVNPSIAKTISCVGATNQRADITNFVIDDCNEELTVREIKLLIREATKIRIRKLTPKECFRLMAFEDKDIDCLIENNISNAQLYKMAGNSIVVDVLVHLLSNLW